MGCRPRIQAKQRYYCAPFVPHHLLQVILRPGVCCCPHPEVWNINPRVNSKGRVDIFSSSVRKVCWILILEGRDPARFSDLPSGNRAKSGPKKLRFPPGRTEILAGSRIRIDVKRPFFREIRGIRRDKSTRSSRSFAGGGPEPCHARITDWCWYWNIIKAQDGWMKPDTSALENCWVAVFGIAN